MADGSAQFVLIADLVGLLAASDVDPIATWMSPINLVLRSRPKVGVSKDGHWRGGASGHPSRRRASHGSSG